MSTSQDLVVLVLQCDRGHILAYLDRAAELVMHALDFGAVLSSDELGGLQLVIDADTVGRSHIHERGTAGDGDGSVYKLF
jgi:hypothetical protein